MYTGLDRMTWWDWAKTFGTHDFFDQTIALVQELGPYSQRYLSYH